MCAVTLNVRSNSPLIFDIITAIISHRIITGTTLTLSDLKQAYS